MAGSATSYNWNQPDQPEFSADLPKKLVGPSKKAGAEAYQDEDLVGIPAADLDKPVEKKISIPAPSGRGSVTQLRANPTDRHAARSDDVQTPAPLSKPMEPMTKKASAPVMEDDLAEIAGSLQPVNVAVEVQQEESKEAAPAKKPKDTGLFSSSSTTPADLDKALIEKYGISWLEWTPETLWQTIRMDYNTQISAINQDKINALLLLHVSDSFWHHWETFEKVVLAFNNVTPHFDRQQDITVGQMLHAAIQANQVRKEVYRPEVLSYVAVRAREDGFLWLPEPLDVAQARLDQLNPPEMVPLKKEVRERWDAFGSLDLKNVEFKEDIFGVHLAKLAAIDAYLKSIASPGTEEEL